MRRSYFRLILYSAMKRSVPDRWFDYSNLGNVIPGTPFIACKTPLQKNVDERRRFTPEDLISSVKTLGKNLVCVIDLTNTHKYYNKNDFESITHVKIFTPGHVTPSPEIVSQFFEAVDSCKKNFGKDDVIAVHCTHGVNRTGYLVCRYMIDKLNFNPKTAIDEFNLARGHKIERANYLSDLTNEPVENFTGREHSRRSQKMTLPKPQQQWSQYRETQRYPNQNRWDQDFLNGYYYENPPRHFAPPQYDYDYENSSYSHPNYHYRSNQYNYQGRNAWQDMEHPYQPSYDSRSHRTHRSNGRRTNQESWRNHDYQFM